MKLDQDFIKRIQPAIYRTWDAIGSDVLQCCDESGEPCDNDSAIESCIDANRLATFATKEDDELIIAMIEEHKYDKVLKFLSKYISLN